MPGPFGLTIWFLGMALELTFVVCSLARRSFLRYLFLNIYVIFSLVGSISRFLVLRSYGQDSDQYMHCYYYTDLVLTVALFVAVLSLYSLVLSELKMKRYINLVAAILLIGTTIFSYAVVSRSADDLSTALAFELSQNLYFVGLILTYILWGAVMRLKETRTRLVQFVLSMGLYFSAYAACYAMVNMAKNPELLQFAGPALGCLLPLAWTITTMRHSEDSRLATAQLVAVQR